MIINAEYWANMDIEQSQTWHGVEHTTKDMYTGFNDESIPLNQPLDLSISPWAINVNADILGLKYPLMWRENNTVNFVSFDLLDLDKDKNTGSPFYFGFAKYTGNVGSTFNWEARNGYDVSEITTGEYRDSQYIITNFDYSRFAYLIQVSLGYKNPQNYYDFIDKTSIDLSTFITNYEYYITDYDIIGLNFIPYYAYLEEYPEARAAMPWNINTLSEFIPISEYITASGGGYAVPFLDNFISLNGRTVDTTIQSIGVDGNNYVTLSTDGETWAENAIDSYNINFAANVTLPVMHSGSEYANPSTWWKTSTFWAAARDAYYRTYLDIANKTQEEVINYILKQAAYMGTWFCISSWDIARTENGTTNNWFIGEIDSKGITTGNWERGTDTENINNSSWINPWDDSGYNGRGGDPNTYDDNTTILNPNATYLYQNFTRKYVLTRDTLNAVSSYLFSTISTSTDSDFWNVKNALCNNPLDVVIDLLFFPFDIKNYMQVDEDYRVGNVIFGTMDSNIETIINDNASIIIDGGSCSYYPVYGVNDFRSYPPYSTAKLYIPFCGSVEIDPDIYLNHTISVKYIVDMNTGNCLALVYRDNLVVDTIAGQMATKFPISGIQSQTLALAERQAETNLKTARNSGIANVAGAATGIIGGAITGNPFAVVGGVVSGITGGLNAITSYDNAQYNLEHINVPYKVVGTATTTTSFANELQCRLVIKRPVMLDFDSEIFAHTTGYNTLDTVNSLEGYTGYTEFSEIDLSGIEATKTEKAMIYNALLKGVYL